MLKRLEKIIWNYTDNHSVSINKNTALIADLGFNSLDLVTLACTVEDEFDIEIPNRAIPTLKTVGNVIAFIEKQ